MKKNTKNSLQRATLALSLLIGWGAACGGNSPGDARPQSLAPPPPSVVAPSIPTDVPGVETRSIPTIPATAVDAPTELIAEFAFGNPNAQLTKIAGFMDAVRPGIGAMMSSQFLLKELESAAGAKDLVGVDLNGPLFSLMLDSEENVLVAKLDDVERFRESVGKTPTTFVIHGDFVALGPPTAISKVAPYALSNLITQDLLDHPTLRIHVAKIVKGKKRSEVQSELSRNLNPTIADAVIAAMEHISQLRFWVETSTNEATLRMVADVSGGTIKRFSEMQKPSSYRNMKRTGSGPWGAIAGGTLDWALFTPVLTRWVEKQSNPLVAQFIGQVDDFKGDMSVAVHYPRAPEAVLAMEMSNSAQLGKLINGAVVVLGSTQKQLNLGGMNAVLRRQSIKTKRGNLHEFKLTPKTAEQRKLLGKSTSAFVGVVADTLVLALGSDARTNAKTLSTKNGRIKGRGTNIGPAMEVSMNEKESFLVALDIPSFVENGGRPAKDVSPLVIGLAFSADDIRARAVLPISMLKEVTN